MQENEMLDLQNKIGVQTSQAVGEAPAQNQPSAQVQNPEAIRNAMKNFQISNIVRNLGRGGAAPTQQRQAAPRQPQQPRIQIPDPDVFRAEVMSTPNLLQQMLHVCFLLQNKINTLERPTVG